MKDKYYLALFNYETWNEFLKIGASVYGTTLNKQSRMEKVKPGEYLICYVTKISSFVGLLEITSKSYVDESRIWENNIYPVRVDVQPILILKAENGIQIYNLKEELTMFKNQKSPNSWKGFFLNSLNVFREHDIQIIIEKLKEMSNK
jgi:predicted RNA-binding protein